MNALIVEDNATYRQSLHQLLAERFPSMQVAEAADGAEALRQGLAQRFDLVFMDIRLPDGSGLDLTRTIKSVFVHSTVCIITGHDILEYREAAFLNGADHFMVKGDSTEKEIVELVESWLRTHFVTLVIVSDALFRKQLSMLLSIHWPVMIVAEAMDAGMGLGHATSLNPDLVLLELSLPGFDVADLVRKIRAGNPQAVLIGMTDDVLPTVPSPAFNRGVDHCVPLTPMGHTELVAIVNAMQPKQTHH
jgi:DNA-binding NarL/FixJ family response regulator